MDDSIQKGDTARRLCQLLREAGAKEVHLRIASPIITSSCFHGTEFIDEKDLCGSSYSEQEMCQLFRQIPFAFCLLRTSKNFCQQKPAWNALAENKEDSEVSLKRLIAYGLLF